MYQHFGVTVVHISILTPYKIISKLITVLQSFLKSHFYKVCCSIDISVNLEQVGDIYKSWLFRIFVYIIPQQHNQGRIFKRVAAVCGIQKFSAFLENLSPDDVISELTIAQAVQQEIESGDYRVLDIPTKGQWFGITYESDVAPTRAVIADYIEKGVYPSPLNF